MNLINKQLIGTLVFFSVMIVVAISYCTGITSMVKTSNWVAHTHKVISFGNLIQKLLVDMETGERGFLITGKENFLEPYKKGEEEYLVVISHTKTLVSDNPGQVKLLEEIDTLVHKWQRVAATPEINTRLEVNKNKTSSDAIKALIEKETGKAVMDELRAKLTKFNNVEEKLLTERRKESKEAAQRSVSLAIIGTFLATIIGFFSIHIASRKKDSVFWENKTEKILKSDEAGGQNIEQENDAKYMTFRRVIILVVLIGAPILFVLIQAGEDKDITTGRGYGFEIGESKLITYEQASLLKSEGGFYGIRVGGDKQIGNIFTDISDSNYLILKYYDEWYIEYNVKRIGMNTVHLSFVDNKLHNIHKHYQMVILPDFLQNIFSGERNEQ